MRLATLILSLIFTILILLQSCAAGAGGEMVGDEATSEQGAVGVIVAFTYLIGGAFVMGIPWVSVVAFIIGGISGLAAAGSGDFADLAVWGGAAFILAGMSYLGVREKKKQENKL